MQQVSHMHAAFAGHYDKYSTRGRVTLTHHRKGLGYPSDESAVQVMPHLVHSGGISISQGASKCTSASFERGSAPVLRICKQILKMGPSPLTEALKLTDPKEAFAVEEEP